MALYACILVKSTDSPISFYRPCGSASVVRLDGRLSADNALSEAVDHFTRVAPQTKHLAVFRAESLAHTGRVIATFPHGLEAVYSLAVFDGCYK